jgi:hypothetical protein
MKLNPPLASALGLALFALGILTALSISLAVVWGEIEVRLDVPYQSTASLKTGCPLMLSPTETGKIEALIVNVTEEKVQPTVLLDVNRRQESASVRTVPLNPGEVQLIEWEIDGSNVIFERLILVNVFQSPYSDNLSRLGYCSIVSFSLFGLTGAQTLTLLVVFSLICILLGGGLWLIVRKQSNSRPGITQPLIVLAVLTITALLASIVRWWGLTLLLVTLLVLLGGVLATEFIPLMSKGLGKRQ